jgi:cytochrome b subunit of formate dehydrogenase
MVHKTVDKNDTVVISNIPLEGIAFWHTLGAFLLMVFLVVHVYMTTTGHTPTSNIQAMITGYEELEDDDEETTSEKEINKIDNNEKNT